MTTKIEIDAAAVINRMKQALDVKTDVELSSHFEVSNKAISSWKSRNSIPLEFILQVCVSTGQKIDYFLFGETSRSQSNSAFDMDLSNHRLNTMKLLGERVLVEILEKHAPTVLASMADADTKCEGETVGISILLFAEFIENERKALVDSGRMSEAVFAEYIRKVDRYDLPYFTRAFRQRKKQGPQ